MVIATMTSLAKLTDEEMTELNKSCTIGIQLEDARKTIVTFLDSRISVVAPNLCALIGTSTAAKMISAVGGLNTLATMPPSNIANIGLSKKALAGFSASMMKPQGYISETDIVMKTPFAMRFRAIRLLAPKIALVAKWIFLEKVLLEKKEVQ